MPHFESRVLDAEGDDLLRLREILGEPSPVLPTLRERFRVPGQVPDRAAKAGVTAPRGGRRPTAAALRP